MSNICCHASGDMHLAEFEGPQCCHTHADDLPGNQGNAEAYEPPPGWTAQQPQPPRE